MDTLRRAQTRPQDIARNDARHDAHLRDVVDDGIALMRVAGTLSALEYLRSHAVDARIIARVLLEPGKRRSGAAHAGCSPSA